MDNSRKEASPWWITLFVLLMFFGAFYYLSTYKKSCHVGMFSYACVNDDGTVVLNKEYFSGKSI